MSPTKVFSSAQALGRALSQVRKVLPKSPRKKTAVVKRLAEGFDMKAGQLTCNKIVKEMKEVDTLVKNFYLSDLISRQLPGKDYITVNVDGAKEKLQKRIFMMTVREAFPLFKEEHSDISVGKSKFASL